MPSGGRVWRGLVRDRFTREQDQHAVGCGFDSLLSGIWCPLALSPLERSTRSILDIAITKPELAPDRVCDCYWRGADIYPDVRFVRLGLLEVGKLTVEQARGHEMRLPCSDAGRDGRFGPGQEHEHDTRPASIDRVAIRPLESRAGDESVFSCIYTLFDPISDLREPSLAVCIDKGSS